jgi:hypothetical protein
MFTEFGPAISRRNSPESRSQNEQYSNSVASDFSGFFLASAFRSGVDLGLAIFTSVSKKAIFHKAKIIAS